MLLLEEVQVPRGALEFFVDFLGYGFVGYEFELGGLAFFVFFHYLEQNQLTRGESRVSLVYGHEEAVALAFVQNEAQKLEQQLVAALVGY